MQVIAELVPNFIGGSADLSTSTKTYLNNGGDRKIAIMMEEIFGLV